jgi:hypothetical protein
MRKFSTLDAVKITGVSRSRIDQMISRGYIKLREPTSPGKNREFGTNELAEIMALDALTSVGIDVGSSEMMQYMPLKIGHYHVPDPMLLVFRKHNRLIPTGDRGDSINQERRANALRFGTALCLKQTNRLGLQDALADTDLIGICAIPLTEILLRADANATMV